IGIDDLLEAIVKKMPAPAGDRTAPTKALVFDSHFDPFRGVVAHVRVFEGSLREGQQIAFFFNDSDYEIEEIGRFRVGYERTGELSAGEVGYFLAGIRTLSDIRVGDTVTDKK